MLTLTAGSEYQTGVVHTSDICEFQGVAIANIYLSSSLVSVRNDMLTSMDAYLSAAVLNDWVLRSSSPNSLASELSELA